MTLRTFVWIAVAMVIFIAFVPAFVMAFDHPVAAKVIRHFGEITLAGTAIYFMLAPRPTRNRTR